MGKHRQLLPVIVSKDRSQVCFAIFSFVAIAVLIGFRQSEFRFIPVMWAEDGTILIQRAIDSGWQAIFQPYAGYYQVVQQAYTCFWYTIFKAANNITLLWWCIGYTGLAINSLCIVFFIDERFEWLVKDKKIRLIAAMVISIVPWGNGSNEMLMHSCTANFWMFWAVFLISLDLLFNKKIKQLQWWEALFFSLVALSSATAPLILAIDILIALRYYIHCIRTFTPPPWTEHLKFILVISACFIQLSAIFGGSRLTGLELSLLPRFWILLKNYTLFLPFELGATDTVIPLVAGIIFWAFLITVSKTDIRITVYSFGVGFAYWTLSSAVNPTIEGLKTMFLKGGTRYLFIQYLVWGLMLSICIINLWSTRVARKRYIAGILSVGLFILLATRYTVSVPGGAEFSSYYNQYAKYYDRSGQSSVHIPVPPWRPWEFTIPSDISNSIDTAKGGIFLIDYVDGQATSSHITVVNDDICVVGWASTEERTAYRDIFVKYNNEFYPSKNVSRPDLSDYFDTDESNFGFEVYIPKAVFSEGNTIMEIVAVDSAGTVHYMTQALDISVM